MVSGWMTSGSTKTVACSAVIFGYHTSSDLSSLAHNTGTFVKSLFIPTAEGSSSFKWLCGSLIPRPQPGAKPKNVLIKIKVNRSTGSQVGKVIVSMSYNLLMRSGEEP